MDEEKERLREELRQRERQLQSQPAIEQVKGMLMQDFAMSEQQAFAFLRRLSQDTNTKTRDLAERLRDELTGLASDTTSRASLDAINALVEQLRRGDRADDR